MERIEHRSIPINGLQMHVAETDKGPLVLLSSSMASRTSGTPGATRCSTSQITIIAPDLRVKATPPPPAPPLHDPSKFTLLHLVGDLIHLLDAISPNDADKGFVVGHDWELWLAERASALLFNQLAHTRNWLPSDDLYV